MTIKWTYVRVAACALGLGVLAAASAHAQDPRVGLTPGWKDAKSAASGMQLVGHGDRPTGLIDPNDIGNFLFMNSDLAFKGNLVFQGNFNGFQIWDVANPAAPKLRTAFVCSGGQGDPSIYGNLLFISVEMPNGRVDCGTQGVQDTVSAERFRGVRIFDISDLAQPKQVAAVQTCRGSHTHTLVFDPKDKENVYVYVSGTAGVRSPSELAGCSGKPAEQDPNTALFRIEVIQVPLARPQDAKIVSTPRIFADSAGNVAGLWKGGAHGEGTQFTAQTNMCHDITVYSAIGLAAGACSGNGIILDISDPVNPKRVAAAMDPNFSYWHSATFSNDGKKVIFTDEWGGGTAPRCRVTDKPQWGANALFTLEGGKLDMKGYYKLPAAQDSTENCVAHNGSLVPVPGRDIMAQGWYQGGVSVFDFTDPAHPVEIAYFDRGPMDAARMKMGGSWGAYWYNGLIYSSELGRGFDIFRLVPSQHLSKNEIDAANLVRWETFNPQNQEKIVWPANVVVARAYLDQLARNDATRSWSENIAKELDAAEKLSGGARKAALGKLATKVHADAQSSADAPRVHAVGNVLTELAK